MTEADLERLVDSWHQNYCGVLELHAFLGMTREEYKRWVETGELPWAARTSS